MRVLHEKFLLLQLTVIFMAHKAMLIVRVTFTEFYQIQLERSLRKSYHIQLSVDGCWEMKMWLYQKSNSNL